ncbi:barstar family protein [Tumebacillus sp. DT12]|uniref:Barstar family protein n=1 Tax=Tumebacillus lacus TaxID=2995335 RepID=A0ABT3X4Q2_9BACL|nr:barstar family protein [Tumebacillus lacus]MCX7570591.1 barstar family protein [Tumebacillus lacus]
MNNLIRNLSQEQRPDILRYLAENDFHVYELDGENIIDRNTFRDSINKNLPQDPPLNREGYLSLDAFIDSISVGLAFTEDYDDKYPDRQAIIWNHADRMASHSPIDYHKIMTCFQDIIDSVSTTQYGFPKPIKLLIFLLET